MKACIFDLDGTLLDTLGMWGKIDDVFLKSRGLVAPDYRECIRKLSFYETAEYTVRRFELDETPEDLMTLWTNMALHFYTEDAQLKPYAKDYLFALKKAGYLLGIATSNDTPLFLPALSRNGVFELFDAFATTFEVPYGKTRPDVFLLTAERLGVAPSDCVVFEDTPEGIKSAKMAGMTVYGIYDATWDYLRDHIASLCDAFLLSFKDAPLSF
ncbi:MAG: HAD family phosphatase [Clostridiales bacterium]|jgi:HAD superfamily hydrolase (TIGR01509 family)|nr:HAD family phosphatase [Clostridiales bacterium]MDR2751182.1 HAD family phosphatase [Clostridiales bacterium]